VRIVFLRTVIAAALCAAACASASRSGKSNASVASAAPSTRAPTASSPGESLARAAAIWARIDRGAVAGADVLQELAREARSCADDARRAWLAVQPEAADAKSLPQVLAAAGPAAAQPMYLTAACTSAWTRAQGFTLLIDHRDELGQIFTRVAQLAPDLDEAGAERELGKLFAALPAYAGGDLRKARSHFEAALERAPDSTRTRIAFARSVAVKAQDRALFEQQLNAAAELPDTMGATEARDLLARENELFGPAEAAQPIPGGPTH